MFIGRKKEKEKIKKHLSSNSKELIAITGKRGIGKTELALNIIESEKSNFLILNGKNKTTSLKQLKNAEDVFNYKFNKNFNFKSWTMFFIALLDEIKTNHLNDNFILFIDEFPWLHTKGNDFVNDFGSFWNNIPSSLKIKIIITGSAVSWLNKNVFRSKGGLYHKTTLKIHLKSFDLMETKQYLSHLKSYVTTNEVLDYYSITGGVARYLNQLDLSNNFQENVIKLFLNNNYLDFFNNSFNSTKTDIHQKIVSLFKDRIKISSDEIVEQILKQFSHKNNKEQKISLTTIYSALNELEETDVLYKINEKDKNNLSSYVLCDLFLFYAIRNEQKNDLFFNNQKLNITNGYAFEILTLNNIHLVLKELGRLNLNTNEVKVIKWHNKNCQIDLMVDYQTDHFSLIECKRYNDVYELNNQEIVKIENRQLEFLKNNKKKTFLDIIICSAFGIKNRTNLICKDVNFDTILNN